LRELSIRLDWLRVRLNELEEQKRSVLRDISHELKTPLSVIREGAELLNEEVVGSLTPEQAEVAAILRDNSIQLQKRIEDLLKFNVAISQPSKLHVVQLQLDDTIRGVLADHRLISLSKQLAIEEKLAAVEICGDREKIKTIVDNLLSNAIKFSPMGGKVTVELVSNDNVAVVNVQDEGPGIDSQERHRVFEAFYQGHVSAKGHVKGTGLGLAIVQEYVKMHHGKVEILDQDKGAHFQLSLPLIQP
jgi:two-component system sensor histidine kinase GlrK